MLIIIVNLDKLLKDYYEWNQFDSHNYNQCSSGDTKDTANVPLVYLNGHGGPTSV
jgi:hypothetical protein